MTKLNKCSCGCGCYTGDMKKMKKKRWLFLIIPVVAIPATLWMIIVFAQFLAEHDPKSFVEGKSDKLYGYDTAL